MAVKRGIDEKKDVIDTMVRKNERTWGGGLMIDPESCVQYVEKLWRVGLE